MKFMYNLILLFCRKSFYSHFLYKRNCYETPTSNIVNSIKKATFLCQDLPLTLAICTLLSKRKLFTGKHKMSSIQGALHYFVFYYDWGKFSDFKQRFLIRTATSQILTHFYKEAVFFSTSAIIFYSEISIPWFTFLKSEIQYDLITLSLIQFLFLEHLFYVVAREEMCCVSLLQ